MFFKKNYQYTHNVAIMQYKLFDSYLKCVVYVVLPNNTRNIFQYPLLPGQFRSVPAWSGVTNGGAREATAPLS